jgi:BRCT domain type II-containing protein
MDYDKPEISPEVQDIHDKIVALDEEGKKQLCCCLRKSAGMTEAVEEAVEEVAETQEKPENGQIDAGEYVGGLTIVISK